MTLRAGSLLAGRWELSSRLASGGMGEVFQARDRRTGDDVAIKTLHTDVADADIRFAGEIDLLQRFDHPHIVGVVDAGECDGIAYLVMELLPGRSLADLLKGGAVPLDELAAIGAQIASALAYAHGEGVINRDVKPSNILFDAEGGAKLADFGIAKLLNTSGITSTGTAVGTASYIAPEQLTEPKSVGPPSDVYSLGLVLLESATGERPFTGTGTEAALARLARDPVIPATLPENWRLLLEAMTARDAQRRPSASDLVAVFAAGLPEGRVAALALPASADQSTVALPVPGSPTSSATPASADRAATASGVDGTATTSRVDAAATTAGVGAAAGVAGSALANPDRWGRGSLHRLVAGVAAGLLLLVAVVVRLDQAGPDVATDGQAELADLPDEDPGGDQLGDLEVEQVGTGGGETDADESDPTDGEESSPTDGGESDDPASSATEPEPAPGPDAEPGGGGPETDGGPPGKPPGQSPGQGNGQPGNGGNGN